MVLDGLKAALDELGNVDPAVFADGEAIIELHRQLNRLQAVVTRAVGSFDAGGGWSLDGARSSPGWLMAKCRLPKPAAKAEVALSRRLRHLPVAEQAWLAGDIALPHVRTLAAARRPGTEEQMAKDEAMLVGHGETMQFRHFSKIVDYWSQQVDAAGEDDKADRQHQERCCHLSQGFGGQWYLDGVFDPISGTVVSEELTRLEDELFKADWADAKERLGREPTVADLARSRRQRRADALVEMAMRSRMAPADGRRPEPLFTVLVGWETFKGRICELANGTVVAPGSLVPWLAAAWVERVVFQGPGRVIDVGAARRLFVGATRRAVEVRDQECFHPTCDLPASRCQVDHVIPYGCNGPTTVDNGRLACGFHNRARHQPPPSPPPPPGCPASPPGCPGSTSHPARGEDPPP